LLVFGFTRVCFNENKKADIPKTLKMNQLESKIGALQFDKNRRPVVEQKVKTIMAHRII
jgi:hypothetical protein